MCHVLAMDVEGLKVRRAFSYGGSPVDLGARPSKVCEKVLNLSKQFRGVQSIIMNSKLAYFLMAAVFALPLNALAQTAAVPNAPSAASASAAPSGTKIGTINIEQAIYASNEGQRDFEALNKKLEPKQTELKNLNDELDGLKKQLNTQGDKLNETSRANLVKEIEQKQKSFDRSIQDAREDAQNQQNDIAQRILQKMAPLIQKYANDNGYGLILDTSSPWPQGPVLMAGGAFDITKPVVDAYNAQSGIAAPPAAPAAGASRPASTRPAGSTTTKPATSTQH